MKVTNTNLSQVSINPATVTPTGPSSQRVGQVDAAAEGSAFVASPEYLRLLELLHDLPDIREDSVLEALHALQSGKLLTTENSHLTAEAMMRAME